MADIVDPETRSRMMASVRSKDTKPELELRRALHAHGFRYRLHSKVIKGMPDLVLPKFRAVILVHGCFWHRHFACRYATMPATRTDFWHAKFDANVARDAAVRTMLLDAGWRLATIWACALRKPHQVAETADLLVNWLRSSSSDLEIGEDNISGSEFQANTSP
ncbi:very short patch repair endonuclease [Rhizobium ruizarguesonis]